MQINRNTNLRVLMEMIGDDADINSAELFLGFLLDSPYTDTDDIPDDEWLEMLELL